MDGGRRSGDGRRMDGGRRSGDGRRMDGGRSRSGESRSHDGNHRNRMLVLVGLLLLDLMQTVLLLLQ